VTGPLPRTVDLEPGCKVKPYRRPVSWGYGDQMRISELAERVGVPTSTVRYYERVGLLGQPARTSSGYRDYGEDEATRLVFVSRARKMGLSCEKIADLVPIWAGANCAAAQERVGRLIDDKQAEIEHRIAELRAFAAQLDAVRVALAATPPPSTCRSDLSCCVPEGPTGAVQLPLAPSCGCDGPIG